MCAGVEACIEVREGVDEDEPANAEEDAAGKREPPRMALAHARPVRTLLVGSCTPLARGGATTWPTLGPAPAWLWLVLLQAARPSAAFGAPATMAAASTPQARRLSSADATSCCELLREPAAASGAAAQLLCKVAAHGTYSQKYSP